MILNNKKIAFLGDSITEGVGVSNPENIYWNRIKKETGAVCHCLGISGTRICRQHNANPDEAIDYMHFYTRIDKIEKDTDIIMVLGGVNDFGHGDAPLGRMTDRRDDTFYGALHLLYQGLITLYPKARIIAITPLHTVGEDDIYYTDRGLRRVGPLSAYVKIIKEVAEYYSLPILDFFGKLGIQPNIKPQMELYMPDGLHPNDEGHRLMADSAISFLKSL